MMDVLHERPLLIDDRRADPSGLTRTLLGLAAILGAVGLAALLLGFASREPLLPLMVDEVLSESGVSNPVTAVLLNFRSYDTLLEVVVLLVAMLAVWSMDRDASTLAREESSVADPVLGALARMVVPLGGVVAVFLAWSGSSAPGGAFQAGALLAGAGVFLAAAGFLRPPTAAWQPVRAAAAAGVLFFIAVGVGVIPYTGAFLLYPAEHAHALILGIEAVLTVSIAVVLVELFVDVPAVPDPDPRLEVLDPTGDPLGRLFDPEEVLAGAGGQAAKEKNPR